MLFGSKHKPGYHGTGSAGGERAPSTASDARAARAAEKRKSGSTSTERNSNAGEASESRAASRQELTIAAGLSHARYARALGRLESGWGSFWASWRLLGLLSGVLGPPGAHFEPPGAPLGPSCGSSGGRPWASKMAPKWLPGGPPGKEPAMETLKNR